MLVTRVVTAHCHSLALKAAGVSHPLRHAVLVHLLCLAVNLVMRISQLRAYHRWRARKRQDKQRGHKQNQLQGTWPQGRQP